MYSKGAIKNKDGIVAELITLGLLWIVALALFLGFIALLRMLNHRERMALIERGLPADFGRWVARATMERRGTALLRGGLITALVGLALTLGLYPVGFMLPGQIARAPFHLGPWLLPGLVPLAVGVALILSHYLAAPRRPLPPPFGAPPADDATTGAPTALPSDPLWTPADLEHHEQPIPGGSRQMGVRRLPDDLALPSTNGWLTLYRRAADDAEEPPRATEEE
jgi:hypothetical protein